MAEHLYDSTHRRIAQDVQTKLAPELAKLRQDFTDSARGQDRRIDALERKLDRILALLENDNQLKGLKMERRP